jgi:hypothetical protein
MFYLLPLPRPVVWLFAVVGIAVVALLIVAASADAWTGIDRILGRRRPL